ncbi:MAGUK p55 subfamily member 4 [Hoplias malabaricus]|uniref:MAGUK p55 subfamily member 4 n=1 Tax=Hoplias malabaricus TaxID=27720 RepID=UPI003461CDC5
MTRTGLRENGLSKILVDVMQEVRMSRHKDSNGADLLHSLLSAPWLNTLLRVYECLLEYRRTSPNPCLPCSSALSQEVQGATRSLTVPSPEAQELYMLLKAPHFQALLSAHDLVAQKDFSPVLPALPDDLPEDEEAMRIVCLVKNKQPLGATIKKDEKTGEIFIARVIHGGLADRSGLLYAGDKLVEVNGEPVEGLEPMQVIQILVNSQGTILFKVIPSSPQPATSQATLYMRAMVDYNPRQDPSIPCPDAGMAFRRGDLLEVVDQRDVQWWQARLIHSATACAGLIPSTSHFRSKKRELWWSQPYQAPTCIKHCKLILNIYTHTHIEYGTTPVCAVISPLLHKLHFIRSMSLWHEKKIVELKYMILLIEIITEEHVCYIFFHLKERKKRILKRTMQKQRKKLLKLVEEGEHGRHMEGFYIAGFRHSLRLWRRKGPSRRRQSCHSCAPSSCHSASSSPYEEILHYQRNPRETPRLIVLTGPSGVGVNELRSRLIKINPKTFQGPIPYTTRPCKSGEVNGREYHFITKELFEYLMVNHKFIEYGEHKGHLYGTCYDSIKNVLDSGKNCIIDIEPHCIQAVRTKMLKPYIIFVKPPSVERMKLTRRDAKFIACSYFKKTFRDEDFVKIEEAGRMMEAQYSQFFDSVIVNDRLQHACMDLFTAIQHAQEEPQWIPANWISLDEP